MRWIEYNTDITYLTRMKKQKDLTVFFGIFVLYVFFEISQCQIVCDSSGPCSCTLSDGSGVIDISSLGNTDGSAMFADIGGPDSYIYSLNLCHPFNEVACSDASACQLESDLSQSYDIGDTNSQGFEVDTLNQVHVKYTSADPSTGAIRTSDVTLVCDPNMDSPELVVNGEEQPGSLTYAFSMTTKCACGNGCTDTPPEPTTTVGPGPHPSPGPGPSHSSGGISIGTIICIVALSLGFVYLVGGMLFLKLQRQAQGKEVVPNVTFWSSIPGLIRDGFVFLYRKIRGKGDYNKV